MSQLEISPNLTLLKDLATHLRTTGYAILSPMDVCSWANCTLDMLNAMVASWDDLSIDQYLKDGGKYRRRRHASFTYSEDLLSAAPHRAHWQPTTYNALHGGMNRWFEPVSANIKGSAAWRGLLTAFANTAIELREPPQGTSPPVQYIEAHQFRIDTTDGIGRPTPEGAHRDGVDLVAVFFVARQGIKGGETRVFESTGRSGERFTLREPWSLLLLDDERVIHESTPIQPTQPGGYRDTLVLTSRQGSFLDES
jgi:hypothetical protein